MKTFYTRAITAVFFAAVVIFGLLWNEWTYTALIALILFGSIGEFYTISVRFFQKDAERVPLYRNVVFLLSAILFSILLGVAKGSISPQYAFLVPALFPFLFLMELGLRSENPFQNIGLNILTLIYIALPLSLLHFLAFTNGQFTGSIVLCILFLIWANDTGAYIVGSLIGKHKLLPHVSPGKSIEGFFGGGLFVLLVAYLMTHWLKNFPMFYDIMLIKQNVWYVVAACVFLFATVGDLVESLLKRSLGIKDSGNILPGHGGFLDRFDAFLFLIPFLAAIVKILN